MASDRRGAVRTLLNIALFQIGWFASVLGAAHHRPYLGPLVVGTALAIHLRFFGTKLEALLILASALLGTVAESSLALAGLLAYRADPGPAWACPPWIVAMWANFGLTLRHSLRGLDGRPLLATAVGAVAGPLAYVAGSRLGALTLLEPVSGVLLLSVLWGGALYALLRIQLSIKILRYFLDKTHGVFYTLGVETQQPKPKET